MASCRTTPRSCSSNGAVPPNDSRLKLASCRSARRRPLAQPPPQPASAHARKYRTHGPTSTITRHTSGGAPGPIPSDLGPRALQRLAALHASTCWVVLDASRRMTFEELVAEQGGRTHHEHTTAGRPGACCPMPSDANCYQGVVMTRRALLEHTEIHYLRGCRHGPLIDHPWVGRECRNEACLPCSAGHRGACAAGRNSVRRR
jgi:hypothetical protein